MIGRTFPSTAGRQRGFSLIEVIAAFLLFAIGFGVLLEILTGSLRIAHRSADYTQAALWAESKLDQVGVGTTLKDGSDSGKFNDKYRWQMDIAKIDPPVATMGVDNGQPGNAESAAGGRMPQQRPTFTQPMTGAEAGLEQENGIDLYRVSLTVYWGPPGHEQHAEFTTLRAVDSTRNSLDPFAPPPGIR